MPEYNSLYTCRKGLMRPSMKMKGSELESLYRNRDKSENDKQKYVVYKRMFYNSWCDECDSTGDLCVQGFYDEFNVFVCHGCFEKVMQKMK